MNTPPKIKIDQEPEPEKTDPEKTAAENRQLLVMAAHQPQPLFPILNRATSIRSLVILLAILPGLFLLESQAINQTTANSGLQALAMISTGNWDVQTATSSNHNNDSTSTFQPPLATWLTVGIMQLLGTTHPISLLAVAYLSSAGIIVMTFFLLAQLGGKRIGFWATILLATHPSGLAIFQAPPVISLTLCCMIITFWATIRYHIKSETILNFQLFIAGIALGLCALAGGLTVIVPMGILLAFFIVNRWYSVLTHQNKIAYRSQKNWTHSLIGHSTLLLTALTVSGWWLLRMNSQYGHDFWEIPPSLFGSTMLTDTLFIDTTQLPKLMTQLGLFSVFALIGFGRMFFRMVKSGFGSIIARVVTKNRSIKNDSAESRTTASQTFSKTPPVFRGIPFLVIWGSTAITLWFIAITTDPQMANWQTILWANFLLIALLGSAAYLIEEILQRHLTFKQTVIVMAASPVVLLFAHHLSYLETKRAVNIWELGTKLLALIATLLASWCLYRFAKKSEQRKRTATGGIILSLLACHFFVGMRSIQSSDDYNEHELQQFIQQLSSQQLFDKNPSDHCLLIASEQHSAQLEFAIRSHWPHAKFSVLPTWDAAFQSPFMKQLQKNESPKAQTALIIEWTTLRERPTKIDIRGFHITPLTAPQYFQHKDLRAFQVKSVTKIDP